MKGGAFAACGVLAVAVSSSALAQDDLDALLEETVVTTASKQAEVTSAAPALSVVITAEQLRKYGITTVEEAIDFLALGMSTSGVDVTGRRGEVGSRGVLLTGDRGSHVLVLVNGHGVNEPYGGSAELDRALGVPLEAIDRVEVVVGPGSVLYGSNAMFGVVNIVTKEGKDQTSGVVVESELPTSLRTGLQYGGQLGNDVQLSLALEHYERWGPSFELQPQNLGIDPVSQQPTIVARGDASGIWGGTVNDASYARSPSGILRLDAGPVHVSVGGSLFREGAPYAAADFDSSGSFGERRNAWIDLKYQQLVTPVLDVYARAYAQTHEYEVNVDVSKESTCFYAGTTTCDLVVIQAARWAGLELRTGLDWMKDGSFVTLVGVTGELRFAGSKTDMFNSDTGARVDSSSGVVDQTHLLLGAYLQQTWNPNSWLGLNVGARVDRDERFDPVVSPRAAASVVPWDGGTLRLIYAEAFRAPSYLETDFNGSVQLRPLQLEPERVRSVEGAIEQQAGRHRLLFGGFASRWFELVELRQLTRAEANQAAADGRILFASPQATFQEFRNTAAIDVWGLNAGYSGATEDRELSWGGSFTAAVTHAKTEAGRSSELPATPRWSGNARVAYDLPDVLPTLALAGHFLARRPADNAFEGGFTPRPYAAPQLTARLTVSGDIPGVSGLSYRASARVSTSEDTPYVAGPTQVATPTQPSADLAPTDQFRALVGLRYEL